MAALLGLLSCLLGGGTGAHAAPSPYSGSAINISPGAATIKVEAENYDTGGEGVAYHDYDNGGQTGYRGDNIGVIAQPGTSNGYVLGWQDGGEWEGYTVYTAQAATYTIGARVACPVSGHTFHLEFGPVGQVGGPGVIQSVSFSIPNTGSYGTFQDISVYGVSLPAGTYWMRLVLDGLSAGVAGIDCISFASTANDGATCTGYYVPTNMTAGQTYSTYVTMKNVGATTWSEANAYRLSSANPLNNQTWGTSRVFLPANLIVTPGGSYTFFYYVAAPPAPGTYNWQWNMVHELVGYFGDPTPNVPITVYAPAAVPTGLAATGGNAQVTLTWVSASGAVSYNLYRGTTPGGEAATPVKTGIPAGASPSVVDTGRTNGLTYYYQVTAVNAAGTESGRSVEKSATPQMPDFSLSASPSSISVPQRGSGASAVTVSPTGGFTGSVSLTLLGVPTGATALFTPQTTNTSSTLALTVGNTVPVGTYSLTIRGTSGSLVHTAPLTLTVLPVVAGVSLDPSAVIGGNPSTATVTLSGPAPSGGAQVSLSSSDTSTASIPANVAVPAGQTSATFTITTQTVATTTPVTISATYNGTAQATLTVNPPGDFSLSAAPSSLTIVQGDSGESTISINASGSFNGNVSLTASGLPSGVTATFAPLSTATTSTLTLIAGNTAAIGPATVTITGTGNGLTRTTTLNLTVTAAPVVTSITVTPTSAPVNAGDTLQFTATAYDQYGSPLNPQPSFTWNVSGGGTIDGSGLFTAYASANGTYTVTAAAGGKSGNASVMVTASTGLATPADLAAYATGSGKITLYWSGIPNATGYNVYRGTAADGEDYQNPVNGNTPVTTQDTGPGVTNIFQFSDTGLTDGIEYFYTVKAVSTAGESDASNEDSDVPDPAAVPWDSGNPSAILSAFRNAFASDVTNLGTGSYALRVVGPDNVIYDDSYSVSQAADGTVTPNTNQFTRTDGTILALPDDEGQFDAPDQTSAGESLQALSSQTLISGPARGPFRRVKTVAAYRGESGTIYLPTPSIIRKNYPDGTTTGDTAQIFLGIGGGGSVEVDAGFQYSPTNDWGLFMNIGGRYVGTGKKPIPPVKLENQPTQFVHFPAGSMPTLTYWAWGTYPTTGRAKLSLLLADDSLEDPDLVGALGAPASYLKKQENISAKRVHTIAQLKPGVFPTGSSVNGVAWSQGYVILPGNQGTFQGWSTAQGTNTPSNQDVKYEGGHSTVSAVETSPYIQEDNVNINIAPN